jgi:hypothetical protein
MNNNLALILRGISYYNNPKIEVSKSSTVNYKNCLESVRENLIKPLKTIFEKIDIFIVTYDSEILSDLRNDFQPIDQKIYPIQFIAKVDRETVVQFQMLDAVKLIEPYDYKYVLITRFDLYYYNSLNIKDINLEKFNFGWVADVGQADDNFLLFNKKKYLHQLKNYFSQNSYPHGLNKFVDNPSYICKLDPHNGYNYPYFYIFARCIEDYKNRKIKLY